MRDPTSVSRDTAPHVARHDDHIGTSREPRGSFLCQQRMRSRQQHNEAGGRPHAAMMQPAPLAGNTGVAVTTARGASWVMLATTRWTADMVRALGILAIAGILGCAGA